MKKKIIFGLISILTMGFLGWGAVAGYVYFKDTGVPYKGRNRYEYNWRYVFAKDPKAELKYDGKLFSFTYLTDYAGNELRVFEKDSFGSVFAYLLDINWFIKPPDAIKTELAAYLSSNGNDKWLPTATFCDWFLDTALYRVEKVQKLSFKDGSPVALMTVKSIHPGLDGNYRYLISEHNGMIIVVENVSGAALSEEQYRSLKGMEVYSQRRQVRSDAERDWQSLCMFRRLLESFEFKK